MIASPSIVSPEIALAVGRTVTGPIKPGVPRPASDLIATFDDGQLREGLSQSARNAIGTNRFAIVAKDILAVQIDAPGPFDQSAPHELSALLIPESDIAPDMAPGTKLPAYMSNMKATVAIPTGLRLNVDTAMGPAENTFDLSQDQVSAMMLKSGIETSGASPDELAISSGLAKLIPASRESARSLNGSPELSQITNGDTGKTMPTGSFLPQAIGKTHPSQSIEKAVPDGSPPTPTLAGEVLSKPPIKQLSDALLPPTSQGNEPPREQIRLASDGALRAPAKPADAVASSIASLASIEDQKGGRHPAGAPDEIDADRPETALKTHSASSLVMQDTLPSESRPNPAGTGAQIAHTSNIAKVPNASKEERVQAQTKTNDQSRSLSRSPINRSAATELSSSENVTLETASAKLGAFEAPPPANQSGASALPQNSSALTASAPNVSVSNNLAAISAGERPTAMQLDEAIDHLAQAREASRAARSELTVRHGEFGAVNLRLEATAGGDLRALLTNRDPGFVPAIQAALSDRTVAAASETSGSANNQSGSRQPENGSNGTSANSQNGESWGSGAGSEGRYGSFLGGERNTSQPSLEQLDSERHSGLSRDGDAAGNLGPNGMREKGLFA